MQASTPQTRTRRSLGTHPHCDTPHTLQLGKTPVHNPFPLAFFRAHST